MSVHFWHVDSLSYNNSSLSKLYAVATKLVILSVKCLTFCLPYRTLCFFPILFTDEIPIREELSFNVNMHAFEHWYSFSVSS